MPTAGRLTGKSGYLTFGGYNIPITKWSMKTTRNLPDSTDNGDYNSTDDLIYHTRIPVSVDSDVSIEGRYHKDVLPGTLIAVLFTGATAVNVSLGLDSATVYGHGAFDLMDFSCDLPIEDMVTFSATLKSNGQFVRGS